MAKMQGMNPTSNMGGGLFDLIESLLDERTKNIHTQYPAKVIEVNHSEGWVTVQPLIRNMKDRPPLRGEALELDFPPIPEVPIVITSAKRGVARISMPVSQGDVGVLFLCARDTDTFLNSDGVSIQDSDNYNSLSQDGKAYMLAFLPEIFTASANKNIDPSNIVIENGQSKTTVSPDGTISSTNGTVTTVINPDGSGSITNSGGGIQLLPDGSVNINGFIITPTGAATSPVSVGAPVMAAATSLTVAGTEMSGHNHSAGGYQDAESRPITGISGDPL